METSDDFQKKAFELWMAVTMFMSTYAKESNNGVVKSVSAMLPYATDLQNFWSAYQSAQSNGLIRKLHTKVRSRVKLMQDSLNESMRMCEGNQRLLDKYSENHGYIERKLNEVYALIPKEPRKVDEPEQMTLDFQMVENAKTDDAQPRDDDGTARKSERFLKRLNELRTSVNGFVSSYPSDSGSVVGYVSDMEGTLKVLDALWRRRESEGASAPSMLADSIRRCIGSLEGQLSMSIAVGNGQGVSGRYSENHEYVSRKLADLKKALPKEFS